MIIRRKWDEGEGYTGSIELLFTTAISPDGIKILCSLGPCSIHKRLLILWDSQDLWRTRVHLLSEIKLSVMKSVVERKTEESNEWILVNSDDKQVK